MLFRFSFFAAVAVFGLVSTVVAQEVAPTVELLISIPEQRLVVIQDGGLVKKYKVSTSRFGLGDGFGSYQTPLGRLRVCEKLGGGLPGGAVIKHRSATGEVLSANAPGRDPIVSRIIWLEGLEAQNSHARGRGIYIHGTTEESKIGKPVSWGCIRMRSADVIALYDLLPPGAHVVISDEDLPRLPKWQPAPPPPIVAEKTPSAPAPKDGLLSSSGGNCGVRLQVCPHGLQQSAAGAWTGAGQQGRGGDAPEHFAQRVAGGEGGWKIRGLGG